MVVNPCDPLLRWIINKYSAKAKFFRSVSKDAEGGSPAEGNRPEWSSWKTRVRGMITVQS